MELKPHFEILLPGSYFCDIIFTGLPAFPALGTEIFTKGLEFVPGGILNTVIGLQRLGVKVGWAGAFGNDMFSQFARQQAQAEGIDTSLLLELSQPLRRVTVALSYPEDRAFVTYIDPAPSTAKLALGAMERATFDHLHFSSLVLDEQVFEILERCHAQGVQISMDCQYTEQTLAGALLRRLLSQLDLFMPNAAEARILTQAESVEQALEILAEYTPYVIIKDGANGAYARYQGRTYHAPAIPVTPLDTTGAGDVFNAGFLAAYLQGHNPQECLRWGNFGGGRSTEGPGGISTAPTLAELEKWLAGN